VDGAERFLDEPGFRRDLVATLSSTSDRMGRLIERLSEVGTRPTGTPTPRTSCSISALIEQAVSQSGAQAHPGVAFNHHVPDNLSTMADREMLEQVFVNLIRNALDAVGEHGAVSIRAIQVGREIQIEVEDDGCGMSSAFLADSLFRPFATTKSHGLGIGLYQCKSIIEDHGGTITVASTEGRGTRVTVTVLAVGEATWQTQPVS
jgi:signal transduction histidine kinase